MSASRRFSPEFEGWDFDADATGVSDESSHFGHFGCMGGIVGSTDEAKAARLRWAAEAREAFDEKLAALDAGLNALAAQRLAHICEHEEI